MTKYEVVVVISEDHTEHFGYWADDIAHALEQFWDDTLGIEVHEIISIAAYEV